MRILFVGDVVGRTGRTAISDHLPGMIRDWSLDLVVVRMADDREKGFDFNKLLKLAIEVAQ